ncbi:MAG: Fe-S-containing protein, partial [Coriobacteriales bacterium]|nr:Fe-S-containing protein [Coriobacteriales bacterium]
MLEYLIAVQQYTVALAVLLPVLGISISRTGGKAATRRFIAALAVGAGVAAVLSVLKAFTGWIVTEYWNLGFLAAILVCGIVYLACGLSPKRALTAPGRLGLWAGCLVGGLLVAYVLRTDLLYIREFVQGDEALLSIIVLHRFLGWLAGLTVLGLCAAGIAVVARRLSSSQLRATRLAMLAVYLLTALLACVQIFYTHNWIPHPAWLRAVLQFANNYGDLFSYVLLALALIAAALALRNAWRERKKAYAGGVTRAADRVASLADAGTGAEEHGTPVAAGSDAHSPAFNPALRRKARATWRTLRRWSTVVACCCLAVVLSFTVVRAYSVQEVELTPAEPLAYAGTEAVIPLDLVSDGHLHRFIHVSEGNVEVRFIVIKKSEAAYGVGLDACNICGATGYYERDDEVVCKMCDVVMNKQTIGFPGGCNPIPLEFSIDEGALSIAVETLEAGAVY